MTPEEYKRVMEGYTYQDHLNIPSQFWHGQPGEGLFGDCKFVWRYYEPNVGVLHLTDKFIVKQRLIKGSTNMIY